MADKRIVAVGVIRAGVRVKGSVQQPHGAIYVYKEVRNG